MTRKWAALCAAFLFILNFAIVRRLFSVEFTIHMNSNEGLFIAISRFLVEHWPHSSWFPLWFEGIPFENTYTPLQQYLTALIARALGCSTALAYHRQAAFFYCLGPPLLFLCAWKFSGAPRTSFAAALLYSLLSPSAIFSEIRHDSLGWQGARRLETMVTYGEVAHNAAIALLPVAVLFAWLAITRRRYRWFVLCGLAMAASVLINAFAAVDVAICLACLVAAQARGSRLRSLLLLAGTGLVAYVCIAPLLPPSLIRTIRINSPRVDDQHYTPPVLAAWLAIAAAAALLAWLMRRNRSEYERWASLAALVFFAIPAFFYWGHLKLFPQPHRYHLEMELAVCMVAPFAVRHIGRLLQPSWRYAALGLCLGLSLPQFFLYRRYARDQIRPIAIRDTVEYRTAKRLEQSLPQLRSFAGGDLGMWFNAFTDNPQFGAGHDPFSPNFLIEIAVYQIYAGSDPVPAILWLQAFGCHAIAVPGPASAESYKPFTHPEKFEGVLPVLWRDAGVTVYGVPQRSKSLAHVIPGDSFVARPPENGLDVEPLRRYVAAIESPGLTDLSFAWKGGERAHISGPVRAGEKVAVQVTYDPGWSAEANGKPVAIAPDGLDLMLLQPDCDGPCEIDLRFEGGTERSLCRIASGIALLGVVAGAFWARRPAISVHPESNRSS